MRSVSRARLITLSIILLMTAGMVYLLSSAPPTSKKVPLDSALVNMPGWTASSAVDMGAAVEQALFLDDYLFRAYQRGFDKVTLYIGYYHTAAKVGAAHDPMVCFTGQGWKITNRSKGTYQLASKPGITINYALMTAELQSNQELILYWFQTNQNTSNNTASQKVVMAWDRMRRAPEESAFVRLSTKITTESPEDAKKRILSFIEDFYPLFYRYVTGG